MAAGPSPMGPCRRRPIPMGHRPDCSTACSMSPGLPRRLRAFARLAAVIGEASAGYNAASPVAAQRRTTLYLSLAILSRQSRNSRGRRPGFDPDIVYHGEAGLVVRPCLMLSPPGRAPGGRINVRKLCVPAGAQVDLGDHHAIG